MINTPRKYITIFILGWITVWGAPMVLHAQDEGDSPDADSGHTSFIGLLKQGGWAMWPLGFFSMASVGLIIYNGLMIQPARFLQHGVIDEVGDAMESLELESARTLCTENPGPVTNIVRSGLDRIADGHIEMVQIDKALEEASAAELSSPFVLINYLSVIGAVAPMVGLLGTVSGMVKAFRSISAGGLGDPGILASNISEALVTTASGLVVAIPSLIAFYYFKNKYGRIASRVGKRVGDLFFNLTVAVRRAS